MALSEKQQRFVDEYLVDLNATKAAIRAGYSEKTAYSQGQRLLKNAEIQEAVQAARAQQQERTQITADAVLKELAAVAFANGSDFARVVVTHVPTTVYGAEGTPRTEARPIQTVELVATEDIPEEKRAAIASIKEGKHGIEVGSYDKVRALELLGKHLGLFDGRGAGSGANENNLLQAIQDSMREDIDTDDIPEIQ